MVPAILKGYALTGWGGRRIRGVDLEVDSDLFLKDRLERDENETRRLRRWLRRRAVAGSPGLGDIMDEYLPWWASSVSRGRDVPTCLAGPPWAEGPIVCNSSNEETYVPDLPVLLWTGVEGRRGRHDDACYAVIEWKPTVVWRETMNCDLSVLDWKRASAGCRGSGCPGWITEDAGCTWVEDGAASTQFRCDEVPASDDHPEYVPEHDGSLGSAPWRIGPGGTILCRRCRGEVFASCC